MLTMRPGWTRRLSRLGSFYAAGLLAAVVALLALAKLTDEVLEGETRSVNITVLEYLHAHANPTLDVLALGLSHLGGVAGTAAMGSAAMAIFLWRRRPLDAAALAIVLLGAAVLVVLLKHAFRQPRPDLFQSLAPALGYSFPSGHALLSSCLYGYLAALLVLDGPRRRWWPAAALALLVVGISWSRLYLGVHWLSDVLAGGLVGAFWVTCCLLARQLALGRYQQRRPQPRPISGGAPLSPSSEVGTAAEKHR
jgi:membrane-associated phospholipid phosphatase